MKKIINLSLALILAFSPFAAFASGGNYSTAPFYRTSGALLTTVSTDTLGSASLPISFIYATTLSVTNFTDTYASSTSLSTSQGAWLATSGGSVGIGTTSPGALFAVQGNSLHSGTSFFGGAVTASSSAYLATGGGSVGVGTTSPGSFFSLQLPSSGFGIYIAGNAGNTSDIVRVSTSTAAATSTSFVIDGNGRVGIGTSTPWQTLSVNGRTVLNGLTASAGTPNSLCVVASGKEVTENAALTCTVSARDQKTKITKLLVSGLDMVMKITPTQFAYKDVPNRLRLGFIADELQAVDRKLADGYDKNGNARSIDQNAILSVLVKSVQELSAQNDALRARVSALEGKKK